MLAFERIILSKNLLRFSATEIVWGYHSVCEVLRAKKRKILKVYTLKQSPKSWLKIKEEFSGSKFDIQYASKDTLTRIAGSDDHMGLVATVMPFRYKKTAFNPEEHPFILLLDAIQDVRNLGAILRTAYCVGKVGVVLLRKNSASLTAAAIKASAGLAEHLDIYIASSLNAVCSQLKKSGYNFYITVVNGGTDVSKIELKRPTCLVFGNEESGINSKVWSKEKKIRLPQVDEKASYNVSVAAGIFLFLANHQNL